MSVERPYTKEEKRIIRTSLRAGLDYAQIAEKLPGRSRQNVRGFVNRNQQMMLKSPWKPGDPKPEGVAF